MRLWIVLALLLIPLSAKADALKIAQHRVNCSAVDLDTATEIFVESSRLNMEPKDYCQKYNAVLGKKRFYGWKHYKLIITETAL